MCQVSQAADWKGLRVLALQQILAGKVEEDARAILVRPSHATGKSKDSEQHHIASSKCLMGDMRHDHVGYLWGMESKYQIDSAFEE